MKIKPHIHAVGIINESPHSKLNLAATILFLCIFTTSRFISGVWIFWACLVNYGLLAWDVYLTAAKRLSQGKIVPSLLISIATLGAFLLEKYFEAVGVVILFKIGEYFQSRAIGNSKRQIEGVIKLKDEFISLVVDGKIERKKTDSAKPGDEFVVRNGERIMLDGKVIAGKTSLDMSALTGESRPKHVRCGDSVLSGSLNFGDVITIRATADAKHSTVAKIIELINSASERKSKTESFITKFSGIYTPAVCLLAFLAAAIPPFFGVPLHDSLLLGLQLVVILTPCVLVLSLPLCYFIGIGACSKRGILIKGSNYLDALSNAGIFVFDKTGTLTKGSFDIAEIVPTTGVTREHLWELLAYAEYHSTHYIAQSVQRLYKDEIVLSRIANYSELAGFGVTLTLDGKKLLAGNAALLAKAGLPVDVESQRTTAHIAYDGKNMGFVSFADNVKDDSKALVDALGSRGKRVVMLTGDRASTASETAGTLGIPEFYSELLPQDKAEILDKLKAENSTKTIAFAGDGINDAPVLALADLGIAMGKGSDLAIETADIILMTDEPSKLLAGIEIADKTRAVAKLIIAASITVKLVFFALMLLGKSTLFLALLADIGISLFCVLSCIRILSVRKS